MTEQPAENAQPTPQPQDRPDCVTPPLLPESLAPREQVKSLPPPPGVSLMKDPQARVLSVGKPKTLRTRASHYFTKAAAEDRRTADLVKEIRDIDYLEADT